jgi:hypothetical protein
MSVGSSVSSVGSADFKRGVVYFMGEVTDCKAEVVDSAGEVG